MWTHGRVTALVAGLSLLAHLGLLSTLPSLPGTSPPELARSPLEFELLRVPAAASVMQTEQPH